MRTRLKHAIVAGATIALVAPLGVALAAQGASAAPVLLSAGKPATASSSNQTYVAGNVTDGNQASYWESVNNAFPQWVQVDLGAAATVTDITLKIPGGWGARNETVTLQGSTDGSSFTTLKASASYAFTGGNTVAVDVTDTSARYVRAVRERQHRLARRAAGRGRGLRHLVDAAGRPARGQQPRAGAPDHRDLRAADLRRRQRGRRLDRHLLGGRAGRVPVEPHGVARRAVDAHGRRRARSTPTPPGATGRRRSRSRAARAAARGAPSRRPRPTRSARRPATR